MSGEKDLLVDAVERWRGTAGLSFADAYLATLAKRHGCAVYTKNVREMESQGVPAPQPLPTGPPARHPGARRRQSR